ncbi:hypothetical protein [Methylobacillus sp.]|uniref:hypothetical protein n=1 Tax=Methylobacillus sp. TaxID=56818 RepID=UPI0012CEDCCD|nr:hypothetical protein [Methylobacillus sp.]MPS48510.1 hypothetical protein [Methylobacillus sp.]
MSGHLYQLRSRTKRAQGEYVKVNGPHDTYGHIVKSEYMPVDGADKDMPYLNLIRGEGKTKRVGESPKISF